MPNAIRKLIARGYWEENQDDKGSKGEGGNADDKGAGDGKGGKEEGEGGNTDPGKDGKPTDAEAKLLKEVMARKGENQTLKQQLEQVTASLKAFEGLDAAKVRELIAAAEESATKDLEAKGQWDALKKQMLEAHTKDMGMTKAELQKALDQVGGLTGKIAELTVGVAFGQSKFITETNYSVSKMRKLYGDHFEFDGEKVVGYDKSASAKDRTVLVDGKGEPLSFEAALAKLVDLDEDRESILKSKAKPGAGSKSTEKGKVSATEVVLSGRDRIAAALSQKK